MNLVRFLAGSVACRIGFHHVTYTQGLRPVIAYCLRGCDWTRQVER